MQNGPRSGSSKGFWRICSLVPLLIVLSACAGVWAHAEDVEKELVRLRPLEPAQALGTFVIHPGFRVVLAASEPLVASPVAACYDSELRLYVVEMRGYPFVEQQPSGGVVRLIDRDGDGRFDLRQEFLKGLSWPTSIVPFAGGVIVASAPDILYAKDCDGDGVADFRKTLFTGFGISNVQGLVNGLEWGPDGWIHGVSSLNGGLIKNLTRPDQPPVDVRGRDFRFKADGSAFEATSGGGQFGHTYDDWGRRFTCMNSNHIRQVVLPLETGEHNPGYTPPPAVLDVAVEGPAAPVFRISKPEPWRVVRTRERAADPAMARRLPPTELVVTGFFTSATGITIYRGDAFPPEYRGQAWIGDVGGNLVHRKNIRTAGVVAVAARADAGREFLASTDNWFRPVNFRLTPQGTLLILDMYRETIEHPASIPDHIKRHLDLKSGTDRGRLYELVPDPWNRPKPAPLAGLTTAQRVEKLADPNAWTRETARRLLIEANDPACFELLRHMAASHAFPLGRMNAIWTLGALGRLDQTTLGHALGDPEPRIRENAVELAAPRMKTDSRLRSQVLALAGDVDPRVRFQVALAVGWSPLDHQAITALAAIASRDSASPYTRAAVMSSIARGEIELVEQLAASKFLAKSESGAWLEDLAGSLGHRRQSDQAGRFLELLEHARLGTGTLARALLALAQGWQRSGGNPRSLLSSSARSTIDRILDKAQSSIQSADPVADRVIAAGLLGAWRCRQASQELIGLIDPHQPPELQLAALHAIRGFLDVEIARQVIGRLRSMSPASKREAYEVLLSQRDPARALFDAVEAGVIDPGEIETARYQAVEARDPEYAPKIRRLLKRARPADRQAVLLQYQGALKLHGDPARGRAVFQKTCATCHLAEGQGHDVGPNLATVAHRSPEDLLVHILDPNREVAPNFINYLVATSDGRTFTGILAAESARSVTLKRAEAATDLIHRNQIESITSTRVSLMPEGLERDLSPAALADVIAYVKSLLGKL